MSNKELKKASKDVKEAELGPADVTVEVASPLTKYTDEFIESEYYYERNEVEVKGRNVRVTPRRYKYNFRTQRKVPKVGMLLVGWGGNNGTTVTAGILANKNRTSWHTKEGKEEPNYFGSLTQAGTVRIGNTNENKEVYVPLKNLVPMLNPNDVVIGGWDINNANLAEGMSRAAVLEYDLQRQLAPELAKLKPMPSIYYPDFIAANQSDRANNVIPEGTKQEHLDHLRQDIRNFKKANGLESVVILWTANTERFTDVAPGLNMTADEILASIKNNHDEVSPSQIFAVASILEGCPYINGSPQNTLVPGILQLAEKHGVFVGGDDFKSGQTKMKSVLTDFLVSAGIKPQAIVSYNHLGNNDGKNLSAPSQFRSKEISKSNVVDDLVASNQILYGPDEHPDHVVVIKYVPYVKDSKRALDEYTSSIFMGGKNTIVLHNTCEDSLLAAPLMIDLVVMTELFTRVTYKTGESKEFQKFDSILSILSYMLKAPVVKPGTPVINALFKQHRAISNILSAFIGLPAENDMLLEYRTTLPQPEPVLVSKSFAVGAGADDEAPVVIEGKAVVEEIVDEETPAPAPAKAAAPAPAPAADADKAGKKAGKKKGGKK